MRFSAIQRLAARATASVFYFVYSTPANLFRPTCSSICTRRKQEGSCILLNIQSFKAYCTTLGVRSESTVLLYCITAVFVRLCSSVKRPHISGCARCEIVLFVHVTQVPPVPPCSWVYTPSNLSVVVVATIELYPATYGCPDEVQLLSLCAVSAESRVHLCAIVCQQAQRSGVGYLKNNSTTETVQTQQYEEYPGVDGVGLSVLVFSENLSDTSKGWLPPGRRVGSAMTMMKTVVARRVKHHLLNAQTYGSNYCIIDMVGTPSRVPAQREHRVPAREGNFFRRNMIEHTKVGTSTLGGKVYVRYLLSVVQVSCRQQ